MLTKPVCTKPVCTKPIALFLFAHQDDEFGVYQLIVDEQRRGRRVVCAYLTDGGTTRATPIQRNQESLEVLSKLGVAKENVFFAGDALSIPDGGLPEHLESAARFIRELLARCSPLNSIYVPAWEGGHHDHDALHAITVSIAHENGLLAYVRQVPLYNGYRCSGPLFRVFMPIALNGATEEIRIPWRSRLRFMRYCLSYPSQALTWTGLFPFVFLHYVFRGTQLLQPVTLERIRQRPHDRPLYYERRNFFTWEKMEDCLSRWTRTVKQAEIGTH
jgi:LmbE family N-acetylglucosaminyl deacetylase